ncbi:MAG TPA: NADH-quinone oxidoreductase subunit L [Thermoleophilaceae bacterium]|nr:NADH-quinone oxidoreductase subunit L [Thermoleophilaceae bacterium]
MTPGGWGWLVLAFPLLGCIAISVLWRDLPGRLPGWIASGAVFASFVSSVGAFLALHDRAPEDRTVVSNAFDYLHASGVNVDMAIQVDPLSVFMALVVSGVSFLIHVYSVAYMTSDRGHARYFAYLNYFVFSMLLLVMAANFVLLIVGWAFVGAASYLLISYWYRRETATRAGMKAFVMNVIGDVGMVVGAFLLFRETGALDYVGVFEKTHDAFSVNDGTLVAACLLFLVGAFAKSAQLPLHTWLPDAMEGPTPVSALIHAATMVTAGVYLIARLHPLFEQAPAAADVAAIIGCATLLFAATVALVVTDLKRVIAYSTMSQIGYMIMGVASFAYTAGMFHLMTHAFFKALLFMGAGSVIGAMGGEQSLDKMGGFRRSMPFTFATFTIGALALSAFFPFSGLFSKDAILSFQLHRGGLYAVLAVVGYVAAAMTAFYAFRMVFRVFFGEPVEQAKSLEQGELWHGEHFNPATGEPEDTDVGFPGAEHHIAERERPMKAAMAPLAVLSLIGGIVLVPGVTEWLEHFLAPTFEDSRFAHDVPSVGAEWAGLWVGAVLAVVGIIGAYSVFVRRPGLTLWLRDRFHRLHGFLEHKWYFDELYDRVFVRPTLAFGRFGQSVVETRFVQDFLIGGVTSTVRGATSFARAVQSGYIRAYAMLLIVGLSGLGLYFLLQST